MRNWLCYLKIKFLTSLYLPTQRLGGLLLGDLNISEPGALIGFAGPRVVKETIGKDLPKGFQSSEFLVEHGFLDFIVHRKNLKKQLGMLADLWKDNKIQRQEGKLIDA